MRFLACIIPILGGGIASAQDRYTLRLVVKSRVPCLVTLDGRWRTECSNVVVFTWDNYPDKVKRGTITAVQSGDEKPISRQYVLVAGDQPGEICLDFMPRLFRGPHDYPPLISHPNKRLDPPTITEFPQELFYEPRGRPEHRPETTRDVLPPMAPAATPVVAHYPANWELYFWIAVALLLLIILIYSYWKWRICRLWNRELAEHHRREDLSSSGHANIRDSSDVRRAKT